MRLNPVNYLSENSFSNSKNLNHLYITNYSQEKECFKGLERLVFLHCTTFCGVNHMRTHEYLGISPFVYFKPEDKINHQMRLYVLFTPRIKLHLNQSSYIFHHANNLQMKTVVFPSTKGIISKFIFKSSQYVNFFVASQQCIIRT
jgi:hypothetical protein